jgi:iron complex outermembrane receptor protein
VASWDNGFIRASVDGTWTNSYKSGSDVGVQQELVGTADNFSVFPEWKANFMFGLYGTAWSADAIIRWIDKTDDRWKVAPVNTADSTVEAMTYLDLVGTYYWRSLRFTAGVNNVLDEDPPYFHSAFNANTEPGIYDVIGRRFFTSVSWEF